MKRLSILWIPAVFFMAVGLIIAAVVPVIRMPALLLFLIGAVIAAFLLLRKLQQRKPKTAVVLRRILITFICIGIAAASVTGGVLIRAASGQPEHVCDYVILLGAGVNGTKPSLSLRERLDAAYAYLKDNPETVCIVSGCRGSGEDISEAECMYRELVAAGIPAERVWIEDQAENTRQNIRFSARLIEQKRGKVPAEIGIISSEYHLFRASFFAEEEGFVPYGIPAKTGWASLRFNYYLREIIAVWYYCLLGG